MALYNVKCNVIREKVLFFINLHAGKSSRIMGEEKKKNVRVARSHYLFDDLFT